LSDIHVFVSESVSGLNHTRRVKSLL